MAQLICLFNLVLILTWSMLSLISMTMVRPQETGSTLPARLKLDESTNCWGSLFQLQSCVGEVILFFYDGETNLGPDCCHAIHIIEHNCWPDMLSSLGFTSEEGDILQGYCDAEESSSTTYTPFPPGIIVPSKTSAMDEQKHINP